MTVGGWTSVIHEGGASSTGAFRLEGGAEVGVVEVSLRGAEEADAREGVEGPSRENSFEFEFDDKDFCFFEVGVGLCEVEIHQD